MTKDRRPVAATRWCVALCLGALTSLSACNQDRAIAVRRMNEGLNENQGGRMAAALEKLEEAVRADATYADPPYFLGQIQHQKAKRLEDAVASYREAIKRDPDNAQFHYKLGMVLVEQGKHSEAVSSLRKAVTQEKDFAKAWFRLGASQLHLKEYTEGVQSLMTSIKADPTMTFSEADPGGVAFHTLGDLWITFRFYDKALQVYEEGLKFNPKAPYLWQGQGVALLKAGRYPQAVDSFKKAIELDAASTPAYFNLAVAQHASGQTQDAVKTLDLFMARGDQVKDAARLAAASALSAELNAALQR